MAGSAAGAPTLARSRAAKARYRSCDLGRRRDLLLLPPPVPGSRPRQERWAPATAHPRRPLKVVHLQPTGDHVDLALHLVWGLDETIDNRHPSQHAHARTCCEGCARTWAAEAGGDPAGPRTHGTCSPSTHPHRKPPKHSGAPLRRRRRRQRLTLRTSRTLGCTRCTTCCTRLPTITQVRSATC